MTHPILGNYEINSGQLTGDGDNPMHEVSLASENSGNFFGYGDTREEAIDACMDEVFSYIKDLTP